jgi:hypothetical protein
MYPVFDSAEGRDLDPMCTPGAVRTTSVDDFCHGGSTKQLRPPSSYTTKLKREQLVEYGYADSNPADYEEDHLISLEIGGDGSDPKNLWPEPHAGKYNSFIKDKVENWLWSPKLLISFGYFSDWALIGARPRA